jgi:hypothetical protein
MHEDPILAFARDFSNGDEAIVAAVRDYVAEPPNDEELIGFYGSEDYAPRTRAFLATVSLLDNKRLLDAAEDKYTQEILTVWSRKGVIDVATLPAAAKTVFGPMLDPKLIPAGTPPEDYFKNCWTLYGKATEELEQHMAARGKALLSIDATEGDTMFFAFADPETAMRWRGKALSVEDGYYAGVRPPMWDRFWEHLTYSFIRPSEDRRGYPAGTRMREPVLPLAE